ncbi:MAG: PQQ-binding-like beta-propeller repeat protein [Planctomycetota bacterium]
MRKPTVLILSMVVLALAGCGQRSTSKASGRMAVPELERGLDDIALDFSWDLILPAALHEAWIDDQVTDLLVVQLADRSLQGLDATTGMTRFVTDPLPALTRMPVDVTRRIRSHADGSTYNDDRLYIICESTLLCIDAIYGQVIWRFLLPFEPSTAPYVVGQGDGLRVFIGDWNNRLQVLTYDSEANQPYVSWQYRMQGATLSRPAGAEGLVYAGSSASSLACFGLDREVKWRVDTHGPVLNPPVVRNRSLYVGAADNALHAFNRLSGAKLGQIYLDAPVHRSPMLFTNQPETVFVWTEAPGPGLHAITAIADTVPYTEAAEPRFPLEVERMQEAWFIPDVTRLVGSSSRHLYCTIGGDSEIFAIDKSTGTIDWRWDMGDTLETAPQHILSYHDPEDTVRSIYAFMPDNKLVSYRSFGTTGE